MTNNEIITAWLSGADALTIQDKFEIHPTQLRKLLESHGLPYKQPKMKDMLNASIRKQRMITRYVKRLNNPADGCEFYEAFCYLSGNGKHQLKNIPMIEKHCDEFMDEYREEMMNIKKVLILWELVPNFDDNILF